MLGFKKKILKDGTNFGGDMIPSITRGVDWVFIHCDLVTRQTNDMPSDVLYSFSTTDLRISFPFKKEPRRLVFHPVNKTLFNSVRMRVTDGRNNPIGLNGVNVALILTIEEE